MRYLEMVKKLAAKIAGTFKIGEERREMTRLCEENQRHSREIRELLAEKKRAKGGQTPVPNGAHS